MLFNLILILFIIFKIILIIKLIGFIKIKINNLENFRFFYKFI